MFFEWDDDKSQRNLLERGFGFDHAAAIFLGCTLEAQDNRRDYGEVRVQAIGRAGDDILSVVYSDRGEVPHHLSAAHQQKGAETMAIVHRTLEQIRRMKPKTDRARINKTTDAEIRRHMVEDGQCHAGDLLSFAPVIPPQILRKHLGMTQSEFAKALRIPISTPRNWEQGRVLPDPAARSLLTIVAKNPKIALKALAA